MDAINKLHGLRQSIWYDNIQRRLLENGELASLINRDEIRGVTSNPSIFHNAIAKSVDYDAALKTMAWAGWTKDQIFDRLVIEDIQAAADLFLPMYRDTGGGDGYVSIEVTPNYASSTEETIAEAKRLWELADRPNVMVKIPATPEGIPAIRESIAAGININITLIFSLVRYAEVMDAYLRGLEMRLDAGLPIDQIASVASFFVSRVDTKVDKRLEEIIRSEKPAAARAEQLLGKAAIANAKLAYAQFKEVFQSDRFRCLAEKGARLQRPLWASTSTKNPAYRDVVYVEELIGPDTINTMPPQTLDAFRDHGVAEETLTQGVDEAEKTIRALEDLGISMKQVTYELEVEGVKAFSDAISALLTTIDERRVDAQKELGPLTESVRQRIAKLEEESAVSRLYAGDATLWTDDLKGKEEITKRLGWLTLPYTSMREIGDYTEFAEECLKAGFTHVLLLGMGGSSLAPEVFQKVYSEWPDVKKRPGLELHVLDSTDPEQVRQAELVAPLDRTLYLVSSKSGSTSEVSANLEYFWGLARGRLLDQTGSHFAAITDPGTSLEQLARERGFRKVFNGEPTVGGRFSALSAFGLVPAALIGLDLAKLLASASWMARQCTSETPAGRNPGLVLGAVIGQAALEGRDKLTIIADPEWEPLGAWLEQLIAESSGKQGKGIVPVDGEPLRPADAYGKDRLFVYLRGSGRQETTRASFLNAGHPVLTINANDPYMIGSEFYRWEMATVFACAVLGVNPLDQPDVQDNKTRTAEKIKAYQQGHKLDENKPIWESPEGQIFGWQFPGLEEAKTLRDAVSAFIALAKPEDYIALNVYLPRNSQTMVQVNRLRTSIGEQLPNATTVGFGPRFLHSTGQLHKGGGDHALFLQITADPKQDLPIPGQGITFGTLERAQALGDLEALLARDRRAIRVLLKDAQVDGLG